eukprot:scaffold1694_cov413-Prasinococcus_capsulatus_cf.AAC.2
MPLYPNRLPDHARVPGAAAADCSPSRLPPPRTASAGSEGAASVGGKVRPFGPSSVGVPAACYRDRWHQQQGGPRGSGQQHRRHGQGHRRGGRAGVRGSAYDRAYVIQPGDTLWSLSVKFYRDGHRLTNLVSANPSIRNPDLIFAYDRLRLPPRAPPRG